MTELTLLLIKPNATRKHHIGEILTIIEKNSYRIKQIKSFVFDIPLANRFYEEHIGKEFFNRLLTFMTSGLTVAALLEKDEAVTDLRQLIGETNPEKRRKGSIRYLYADSMTENAVHASDTHDHALREIALIFPDKS